MFETKRPRISKPEKPQKATPVKSSGHAVVEFLRFELGERIQKNPRYSLRAFARGLGVSHTLLSLVMNGQRVASPQLVQKIADKFYLDPAQKGLLLQSLQGTAPDQIARLNKKKSARDIKHRQLSLDQFALLSEWQHFAILSLLEIPDTVLTASALAERLGISEILARVSLQRLFDLDLLEKDSQTNKWRQKSGPIVVENTKSTSHTRKFQHQLLEKAIESLENDPIEIRDHSSVTFAMDPNHVNYALKRIRLFRRELMQELESFGNPQEVYNLTVQLFPTSKRRKK